MDKIKLRMDNYFKGTLLQLEKSFATRDLQLGTT